MKKLLALVLALVMTLGLATVGTNAAVDTKLNDADKIDDKYVEAVDVLKAIDVMVGDEKGNFNPTEKLTRAQGAKIVAYLIATNKVAENLSGFGTKFSDVPATHWASGMIEYCAANSILSGYNGKFDPDGGLTVVAFAKLMLTALGYDAKIEGFVDNADWATHVMTKATTAGVLEGLKDLKATDVITREQAAQMAFNTIKAPLVEYTNKGSMINVNGAEIAFGASEAKPMTSDVLKNQTISNRQVNAGALTSAWVVEFAEQYYPGLVLNIADNDVFGRPSNTWTYNRKEVGSYVRLDTKVAEWTKNVTGATLWSTRGGVTTDGWNHEYYVDGRQLTATTAPTWAATDAEVAKDNTARMTQTYRGVLTEMYVDEDNATVTLVFINTYLGIVTADYNAKTEVAPVTFYTALTANPVATEAPIAGTDAERIYSDDEDFAIVKDFKDGDVVKANRAWIPEDAAYETVAISLAEAVENVTVTGYTTGKANTTDANAGNGVLTVTTTDATYERANKAYYDPEVIWNYTDTRQQLKDAAYTIYLDAYGYMLGLEPVAIADQYIFVVGYEEGATLLAQAIDKALIITTDGVMKTVNADDSNLKVWDNVAFRYVDATVPGGTVDTNPLNAGAGGSAAVNGWFTYTMKGDTYVLDKYVRDQGVAALASANGKIDGANASLPTNNPYTASATVAAKAAAYGNEGTTYITVKADNKVAAAGSIVKVTGVSKGIKNTSIKMQSTLSGAAWANFAYNAAGSYRGNLLGAISANDATNPGNVFFIYNGNGYVTYAVVVGEDAGASANKVFFASNPTGRFYDSKADAYYVTYDAIMAGELKEVKVADAIATAANPVRGTLFQATVNQDGWIIGLTGGTASTTANGVLVDNTARTDGNNALNPTMTGAVGYAQVTGATAVTYKLVKDTLWVTAAPAVDANHVIVANGCKVFARLYGKTTYSQFDTVASMLGSLRNDPTVAEVSKVTAICDPVTGYATTIIFTETAVAAAPAPVVAGGFSSVVPATAAILANSPTGNSLKIENATVNGTSELIMSYLVGASIPTQIKEALTGLGYTNLGTVTKSGSIYSVECKDKDGVEVTVTMETDPAGTNPATAYYPVKLDGTVVAYLKGGENYTVAPVAGSSGFVATKGLAAANLNKHTAYGVVTVDTAANLFAAGADSVVINTGYVKVAAVTAAPTAGSANIAVGNATLSSSLVVDYAKPGDKITLTLTLGAPTGTAAKTDATLTATGAGAIAPAAAQEITVAETVAGHTETWTVTVGATDISALSVALAD
jgi:hypothetical protein